MDLYKTGMLVAMFLCVRGVDCIYEPVQDILLICIINSGQIMSCVCLNRGLRGARNVSLIHDMTGL
jgi:hypothetical protein